MVAASELPIETVREGTTATDMAQEIFGSGVTVVGATYYGDIDSAGIYSSGETVAPGVAPSDTGIILSTGNAQDFTNSSGDANQSAQTTTNTSGVDNFAQFNIAAGAQTYDASVLDVDFVPDSAVMTMQFVFSSDEYPEFQNSIYQDFFGVWINGQMVEIDVGDGDVDPGNINTTNNINMYVDNQDSGYNTEMDGFTITMTMTIDVIPGVVNSMRIAIADVADSSYDSNLLIAGNSVQSDLIAISDNVNVYPDGATTLDVLSNDINDGPGTLTITHINGQPVVTGSMVTLPTGQQVTLNADGTFTVVGDGDNENFNFTYTIDNGDNVDTGFVNATSVPCFVAGTMIATPNGEIPVEHLRVGELVSTKDDGPQPLRWLGMRTVTATGDFAPIHIAAGTLGEHRDLLISPLHRVLIHDRKAELLFGEAEVLVAARDLVNGRTITRRAGGMVTYVHLLFDRHQVVFSEGLETESFLPGPQTAHSFEAQAVDEIIALFPELDPRGGGTFPQPARRPLRRFEAALLRDEKVA